ncbi:hypothetical protein [Thalassobaculum sp.]|uniref:hypothetical protein n=1 Tax=Thalassobaculum sp. TaxID=2022740 RepID=UPI0032EBD133
MKPTNTTPENGKPAKPGFAELQVEPAANGFIVTVCDEPRAGGFLDPGRARPFRRFVAGDARRLGDLVAGLAAPYADGGTVKRAAEAPAPATLPADGPFCATMHTLRLTPPCWTPVDEHVEPHELPGWRELDALGLVELNGGKSGDGFLEWRRTWSGNKFLNALDSAGAKEGRA